MGRVPSAQWAAESEQDTCPLNTFHQLYILSIVKEMRCGNISCRATDTCCAVDNLVVCYPMFSVCPHDEVVYWESSGQIAIVYLIFMCILWRGCIHLIRRGVGRWRCNDPANSDNALSFYLAEDVTESQSDNADLPTYSEVMARATEPIKHNSP